MSAAPFVSVIMPCFNSARFVAEAVASVMAQTYPSVELIAVDDGSTDGTWALLQALEEKSSGRMRALSQPNAGPYPARNRGLREARGELIAFLDADDWWDATILEKLAAALAVSDADLAYCGWKNVGDRPGGAKPYVPPAYEEGDIVAQFLEECPFTIHCTLTRRSVIDAVGGFSERYRTSLDYDLWLRLTAVTRKLVRVPEVLAFYRWHGSGQISAVKWRQVIDTWNIRRDYVRAHPQAVAHLDPEWLYRQVDGYLVKWAYKALWRRDAESAQRLARTALTTRAWRPRDLRILIPALLPPRVYRMLLRSLSAPNSSRAAREASL